MPKSYRIRTQPGVDKNINIQLEQDFEYLEILSLKIFQNEIYTRMCSDYGVVIGRVLVNGGFGVPNAKVSVFIPITDEDEQNPIISELYPYKNIDDLNEDGYRYNLLPYQPSYTGHAATGTFPSREDVLNDAALVEVYDKYYKFTVKTNESGDYMIFGVPTGEQTVFMDVDLSDIGCFSLSPQDLINSGLATEAQVAGNKFKTSTNLRELPQVKTLNKIVQVQPLWGEPEICLLGITRVDFDLTASANVNIEPTAIFMGSVISTTNEDSVKKSCKPKLNTGNMCELVAGPGQILAIRQTIQNDDLGYPILEQYKIEQDGKIIDGDGTWLMNLPMNMDYVTTNEFGEQVISSDPNIGIPTTAKYRFKIKWQNEEGLQNNFLRGNFLVPNIKEHGWDDDSIDPSQLPIPDPLTVQLDPGNNFQTTVVNIPRGGIEINSFENAQQVNIILNNVPYAGGTDSISLPEQNNTIEFIGVPIDNQNPIVIILTFYPEPIFNVIRSYAFSLDWDDYGDTSPLGSPAGVQMLNEAINAEDKFYKFHYNKVYTVSSFIDRYKNGTNRARHLGIKEITNRTCQSENNKLPVNDLVRNFDFLFFLFSLLLLVLSPMLVILIIINHILALLYPIIVAIVNFIIKLVNGIIYGICKVVQALGGKKECKKETLEPMSKDNPFKRMSLPMITYPDCEVCSCPDEDLVTENSVADSFAQAALGINVSPLSDLNGVQSYSEFNSITNPILGVGYLPCGPASNPFLPPLPPDALDQQLWEQGAQQLLSGNINLGANYYKVPMWQEFIVPNNEVLMRFSDGMTLAQAMNLANIRARYFDTSARNRITITPNPSIVLANNTPVSTSNGGNSYQDIAFITLMDQGSLSLFEGKLLTFYNPDNIPDPNITGATENQFGGFAVTGTSNNTTFTYPLTYMDSNGNNITANITVVSTESEKEYIFKSGIEYFQVIKGFTWGELLTPGSVISPQGDTINAGVLWKYFVQNAISILATSTGTIRPVDYFSDRNTQEILIMVRGVDPYTERQEMRYDLNELFGYAPGALPDLIVEGEFFLNVPIQQNDNDVTYAFDQQTPQTHSTAINNSNQFLFHPSFDFNVDYANYTAYTTDAPQYYVSTDKSTLGYIHGPYDSGVSTIGYWVNPNGTVTTQNGNQSTWLTSLNNNNYVTQSVGRVDGGSFTINTSSKHVCFSPVNGGAAPFTQIGLPFNPFFDNILPNGIARCYSPAYYADGPNGYTPFDTEINPTPNQRLVFRSDRLPTSDGLDTRGYMSFPLHQNDNFAIYTIDEEGQADAFSAAGEGLQGFNDLDAFSELGSSSISNVVETFSCDGMVPLGCYSGLATSFGVSDPCEANQTGKDGQNKRVNGGCYYFVDDKLIKTIKKDIEFLGEWKVRFRIMFGACRGVFGHMFQNNWINGTLYMPSFNKQTTYNLLGEPTYNYCKDIVFFNNISNNFYYRCTPYKDDTGQFIGGLQPSPSSFLGIGGGDDDSMNTRQILFPTTIMDLGKRDEFISEICSDPDFSGKYLAKTFKSTSYQDSSDVLQVAILSRIVNASFLEKVLGIKGGGIDQFFDNRSGDRVDGDIAQAFSINSEYQVNPFIGGNYPDSYIFIFQDTFENGDKPRPVFGIFYNTSEEEYRNRRALSPGYVIYSFQTNPPLQTYNGYPDTQEVPHYKWFINYLPGPPDSWGTSIFGTCTNEWRTDVLSTGGFYKKGYQDLDAVTDPYFKTTIMTPTFPNIFYGFITNFDAPIVPPPPPLVPPAPEPPPTPNYFPDSVIGQDQGFLTGAPNFFYFGLKNGNTALNRFIKIYIETGLD